MRLTATPDAAMAAFAKCWPRQAV